ncbi:MAG: hypothetical protein H8D23_07870, partial [Candidatus Brocadiales bacterium]|nr:hypothetical protein [Candidatus Brocadiales bacterium]
QRQKEQAEQGNVREWRFKLAASPPGDFVFLADIYTLLLVNQYSRIVNGKTNYYNYETCIRDIEGECPLCENGNNASLVSVATIVDFTEYTKKDGTKTGPRKKIIVLKKGGTERFLRKQEKLKGLKYKKFELFRSSDQKAEATGTDAEYEKDVDINVLKKFCPEGQDANEWIKPFDYGEIFKPKSASEIRRLIGISDPVGSTESEPEDFKKESLADMI